MTAGSLITVCCIVCGQVQRVGRLAGGERAHCYRCQNLLRRGRPESISRTLAFAFAALILYLPANLYPIIVVKAYGILAVDFVWTGTHALWQRGFDSVAALVFLFSMLIPLLKTLILISCALMALRPSGGWQSLMAFRIYKAATEWWMVDVFLLAALVTLIRIAQLADATAGPGLYAVAGMMICTLAASLSFDPELLWKDRRVDA